MAVLLDKDLIYGVLDAVGRQGRRNAKQCGHTERE